MGIDYTQLDSTIAATVERLTPDHIKADKRGLYGYFEAKRDRAWDRMMDLQVGAEKARNHAALIALGGSLTAVGMLVLAGPVVLPIAATVSFGSAGYFAARTIANKLLMGAAERSLQGSQDLLDEPVEEAMREAVQRDGKGGLLSRLYRHARDIVHGYERQAAMVIKKVDAVGTDRTRLLEILAQDVSPGLANYLQRASSDKFSSAAHLMARLTRIAELEQTPAAEPGSVPRHGNGRMFYGWVAAPKGDGPFLAAMGVDLSEYDHRAGCFRVRATASVAAELRKFEGSFPMALESTTGVTLNVALDAARGGYALSLESVRKADLLGLREAVLFEQARGESDAGGALALQSVLGDVTSEFERRLRAAMDPTLGVIRKEVSESQPTKSKGDDGLSM